MKLIIVESPTKSQTIKKILDEKTFAVFPTFGHIRDLPKSKFGIEVKNDFQPTYQILPRAKKHLNKLKKEVKKAEVVFLATDPDREGEKISFDVVETLKIPEKKYHRIVFHEITKKAIEEALKNPRKIDMFLVSAQETRRMLDRIVGYKLSPLLWKKIAKKLSAGRVQSVALWLIVEREKEIKNFVPQEYWKISALFEKEKKEFEAVLFKKDGKKIDKLEINSKEKAEEIKKEIENEEFVVSKIEKKEKILHPPAPFITSTLQQSAFQFFRWSAKMTMYVSQQLFEKGLITYHRTDSFNLSEAGLEMAKDYILKNFGPDFYERRIFKKKSKLAQEAHEAIRPTNLLEPTKIDKNLSKKELLLYQLIWQRFIASQMKSALFNVMRAEIDVKNYTFLAEGESLVFEGFLKVYPLKAKIKFLPTLEKNEKLKPLKISLSQLFTKPPSRYNDASLVKELEKNGIGRPSTYAQIISVLQEKNYVVRDEQKRFLPTEIGILVSDFLQEHFPELINLQFTASMEEQLDKIAQGKEDKITILKNFYFPFEQKVKKKEEEVLKIEFKSEAEMKCPKCQAPLLIKISKYGKFYSCSRFPECKYIKPLENNQIGVKCPKCQGHIIKKRTKKGKIFYGCENYPECDFALWDQPIGKECPKCHHLLVKTKNGKIKCSQKGCDFKPEDFPDLF